MSELDKMAVKAAERARAGNGVIDAEELADPRIFVRGNPSQPGDRVPRQFLRVLAGPDRGRSPEAVAGSTWPGRSQRPKIHSPARVIVNRVWMHHFGEPLVSTPSDFGTRSTPPTHPELLDHLAPVAECGWSLKALHRVDRALEHLPAGQSRSAICHTVDPENHLLWRFPRTRLDLESMRDDLLFVSRVGSISRWVAGRWTWPVTPGMAAGPFTDWSTARACRQFFAPSILPAPISRPSGGRRTTVPQQALFSMNAPFVIEQARALASRPDLATAATNEARIAALYRAVLARSPSPGEVQGCHAVPHARRSSSGYGRPDHSQLSRWEQFAQVLLMTNELLFVD